MIELDASTGTASVSVTAFVQDTSSTLGTISSITSSSDTATVTTGSAHGLQVGMYVHVTGSSTNFVNGIYKVASVQVEQHSLMHKTLVLAAGTIAIFKAYHIVKDVPLPTASTLKIVSGQKIVLNANDKLYAYASAGTVDVIT